MKSNLPIKATGLSFALATLLVMSLSADPAAARPGAKCSGFAGQTCSRSEFCDKPTGACFFPDAEGTCVPVPHFCYQIFRPVCGCNGKTYGNDCKRQQAGMSKAHDGKCSETP